MQNTTNKSIYLKHLKVLMLALVFMSVQIDAYAKPKIKTKGVKLLFSVTKIEGKKLSKPSDVAVYKDNIYICDGDNHRIIVVNKNGKLKWTVGGLGDKDGQFFYPVGITVSKSGDLYVADTKNYRIQVFNSTGKHIRSFDSVSSKDKRNKRDTKKVRPVDIVIDESTKEIFVTTKHHNIVVYNKTGKKIREWGSNGKQNGQFRYPGTLAMMSDSRLAVVDILNNRAQVFRTKSNFSFQIGKFGVRPGMFIRPKGVAIASDERIYITDSYMDVIQVFSPSGKYQHVLGSKGKPHRFKTPSGIAIVKDRLIVAETFDNKVKVYKLLKR